MSRTKARSSAPAAAVWASTRSGGSARGETAEVAHEQQVLEVRGHGRQVLERLDGLASALGVTRAQRRGEDLFEQRRLAVGRGTKDAQVAPANPETRELGRGTDDLALRLVVGELAVLVFALDHPEVLELAHEARVGARLLE